MTYVNDVDLDAVDAGGLEVGVQALVEFVRALGVDEADTVVDDLVDGEVLHGALQAGGELGRHHLGGRQAGRAGDVRPVSQTTLPSVQCQL